MDRFKCSSCGAMVGLDDRFCSGCGETPDSLTERTKSDSPLRRLDVLLRTTQPRLVLASAVAGADVAGPARPPAVPAGPIAPAAPVAAGEAAASAEAVSPVGRARWYRRPWYRRPRVMIPLVIFLMGGIAAGAVAFSIQRTFSTLHEVSTPPATVSGSALGGDDSIVIDTGPAKSAVAAAAGRTSTATATATSQPSATATDEPTAVPTEVPATEEPEESTGSGLLPPPPASTEAPTEATTADVAAAEVEEEPTTVPTDEPTSEPTDEPTEEPTTAPTEEPTVAPTTDPTTAPTVELAAIPTEEPTTVPIDVPSTTETPPTTEPEPGVTLSQIERIKNGSFEQGDESWYLEEEAHTVETDAVSGSHALLVSRDNGWADQSFFFLNGTTYQLAVSGKLGAKGDPGVIGVAYFDANGERLRDLEPAELEFTSLDYTRQTTTFTVPDGVATVKIYAYNGNLSVDFYVDDVSVRSEIPPSDLEPAAAAADDDAINILVMGVDARPGEAIDAGVRPDSLMVVRLNPETGSCHTLAIPRDTRTELPGYGQTKINHALAVGGIPYQQQVVENLLDLKIDHYLLIDFNGFQDLVDAVGGIKVTVEEPFVLDEFISFPPGEQTMDGKHALAYARYRGGPDGDFGRIARQQQVLRALIRKGSKLSVVRSLNELLPAVESNIRTDLDATDMARLGLDYRGTCTDESVEMLRLEGYDAWFDDPLLQMQLLYVVVDEAEIRSKVAMLKEG